MYTAILVSNYCMLQKPLPPEWRERFIWKKRIAEAVCTPVRNDTKNEEIDGNGVDRKREVG